MKTSNLKKKIRKIKKLYLLDFELKGYYISYWLFEIKKKKKKEVKPVQYLKTNRYVIPLPSEDEILKVKKKKKDLFYTGFIDMYEMYEDFFKNQRLFFSPLMDSSYSPDKYYYIDKFDHGLKFEILWILENVFRLFAEQSFCKKFSKKYFSSKKFKFYSNVYFMAMFEKYWNPNLPLLRKKGEKYISKVEGWALLNLWEIIFWELVFENLNLPFKYSFQDLKIFALANIDPYDKRFNWKTWRFYLLGVSVHDGKISFDPNQKFYQNFSQIPSWEIKNNILLSIKKQILAQFLFWKDKLINLAEKGLLFYHLDKIPNKNLAFYLLNTKVTKTFINSNVTNYIELNKFIENKFIKDRVVSYLEFPIPEYYYGSAFEFLTNNYFSIPTEKLFGDARFSILFETDLDRFLKKFQLTGKKKLAKIFYNTINTYIIEKFSQTHHKIKIINNFKQKLFTSSTTILVEKNSKLTPDIALLLLRNLNVDNNLLEKKSIHPLPDFIKYLFLLLLQPNIDSDDIDKFFINFFLNKLPEFIQAKIKAEDEVDENLGTLQAFEFYFKIAPIYNLTDPTMAYKIFFENLKKYPNKDIGLRWEEPFGLNPFEITTKFLTKDDVPFPEAVDYYTFYMAKKKEKMLILEKSFITKPILFKIKIFNFSSIFKKFNNLFNLKLTKLLWFKKKFWLYNNKCFTNFFSKTKKIFNFDFNHYINWINSSEINSTLDFLRFNPIDYNNFSEDKLISIWLRNIDKIKRSFFLKTLERRKSQFVISIMHNILKLNYLFQLSFTSTTILYILHYFNSYYLNINFFLNKKFSNLTNNFTIYDFNYPYFVKAHFATNYYLFNYSFSHTILLKKF